MAIIYHIPKINCDDRQHELFFALKGRTHCTILFQFL